MHKIKYKDYKWDQLCWEQKPQMCDTVIHMLFNNVVVDLYYNAEM